MRKLKLFSLLMLLFVGVTSMWATEEVYKTANFAAKNCTSNASYTGSVTCTISTDTWTAANAANNNGGWDYIKMGAKKAKAADATKVTTGTITTGASYGVVISKVVVKGSLDRGSVATKLIYASNSSFTTDKVEITGPTSFTNGEMTFTIASPVANQYYKLEFVCSNTTTSNGVVSISSVDYYTVQTEPTVTVTPNPIAFGDIKQYAEGPLETQYVFKNFTVTGENLTSAITVTAPAGAIFDLWNVATETTIGTSIELEPDGNGAVEKELAIMAATAWSGAQNSSITISGDDLDADMTINITMTVTPRYSVDVEVNNDEMGTATINGGSVAHVENDSEELTLVATPKPGYEFVNWTYDDTKVLLTDDDEASTTAYAYEAATITANFQAMSCTGLAAPTLNKLTKSYDYANIKWTAVANASTYVFNLTEHEGDPHITNLVTPDLETDMLNLKANTQYDYTVMAVGDGTSYCEENNPLLEGSFTTEDYPTATLTLSENGKTRTWGSDLKLTSVIALPTAVAAGQEVAGKVLVGYTNEANKAYSHDTDAPSVLYAPGANYTIADTEDKLYAVYAEQSGQAGGTTNIAYPGGSTTNMTGGNDAAKFGLDATEWSIVGTQNNASNNVGLNTSGEVRLYGNANGGNALTITAPMAIDSVKITFTAATGGIVKVGSSTISAVNGAYPIEASSFNLVNTNSGTTQVKLTNIAVIVNSTLEFSKYATKGPKLLALPTFTPAAGEYTTAQNVTITAAEGTIYYTTDGTDPTSASTEYTGAIALTTRGKHTIKAIAIDGDNYSNIAKATYTLDLPYASFEELVAAELPHNTQVVVSFSDVVITALEDANGIYLNVKDKDGVKDIEIYSSDVEFSDTWVVGGKVSGTAIAGTWKLYDGVWYLSLNTTSTWDDITYKAPTPTSIDNTEAEAQAVKVVENGQIFIIRGDKTYTITGALVK